MQNLRKENVRVVKSEWNGRKRTIAPKPKIALYRLKVSKTGKVSGKWVKKARKPKSRLPALSKLKKEADKAFSLYIRQKYADKDGMVKSFTGNEVKHWKSMHCGHYLTRSILFLRWNENNARPQSPAENIWKHGNPIEFRINLVEEIGEETVKELESRRHQLFRPDRAFYNTTIDYFAAKLSSLHAES